LTWIDVLHQLIETAAAGQPFAEPWTPVLDHLTREAPDLALGLCANARCLDRPLIVLGTSRRSIGPVDCTCCATKPRGPGAKARSMLAREPVAGTGFAEAPALWAWTTEPASTMRSARTTLFIDEDALVCLFAASRTPGDPKPRLERLIAPVRGILGMAAKAGMRELQMKALQDRMSDVVEAFRHPTLLLDSSCRVQAANSSARQIVDTKLGMAITKDGMLRLARTSDSKQLHVLVSRLATAATPSASPAVAFMRYSCPATSVPRRLRLERLSRPLDDASGATSGPWIAATVFGERQAPSLASDLVREALQLTPSEARLAVALAHGATLRDCAADQGLKVTTLRWHLRNVLRQTGCSSQSDLVRLVLQLSA
jgi:DNA-binding CsgD family transcriptional regulator